MKKKAFYLLLLSNLIIASSLLCKKENEPSSSSNELLVPREESIQTEVHTIDEFLLHLERDFYHLKDFIKERILLEEFEEELDLKMEKGFLLNYADKEEGNTLLHMAAYFADEEIAELLIKKGANIHIKNIYGETPLLVALPIEGSDEVVKLLLDKSAQIGIEDDEKLTVFHAAAFCEKPDNIDRIIKKAISKNLNVLHFLNYKDILEKTPLDWAQTEEVFNFLINKEDELLKRLSTNDLMKYLSLEEGTDLYKEIESKSISEFDDIVLKISKEKPLLLALIKKKEEEAAASQKNYQQRLKEKEEVSQSPPAKRPKLS